MTERDPDVNDAPGTADPLELERPEVMDPDAAEDGEAEGGDETIDHPAKVMRIGTMMKQLLAEVRGAELDEASRHRLREIYEMSLTEVGSALSPDLREELDRLARPFGPGDTPSAAELQIVKAQLVGWLEGLIQGMQAMLFAQQMAAKQQLASMRAQLPSPSAPGRPPAGGPGGGEDRPGAYL